MPSRNTVKQFDARSVYHVYNRGVDKRLIFMDEQDYAVFLSFLKYALLSDAENKQEDQVDSSMLSDAQRFNLRREGLADQVELLSFCLMPNHFHLLLYQEDPDGITKLMRSIVTGYVMYFNKRYQRSGSLFQGVYKASHVNSLPYWQHVSRYIHLNPLDIGRNYADYPYSSYRFFTGSAKADWLKPDMIIGDHGSVKEYEKFVANFILIRNELKSLKSLKTMLANSSEITVQG